MDGTGILRAARGAALALTIAGVATGCQAATTPSPSPSGSTGPAVSPEPSNATATSSPSTGPAESTTDPSALPTVRPTLRPAPAGDWASLSWTRLEGAALAGYPKIVPPVTVDKSDPGRLTLNDQPALYQLEGPNVDLRSVRGGYIQILWDPYKRTLTPWLSSDAKTWHKGTGLDTSAWKAYFGTWDGFVSTTTDRAGCELKVDDFAVGAGGIVVRGHLACRSIDGDDGLTHLSGPAMWASPDGLAWTPVNVAAAFGSAGIQKVDGGSSGFIGLTTDRRASWLSADGLTWHPGSVPGEAYQVADPVAIGGGFAIAGEIAVSGARLIELAERGGSPDYISAGRLTPAAWWSADGVTWQRQDLGLPTGDNVNVDLIRVDDRTVLAMAVTYTLDDSGTGIMDQAMTYRVSHDGRTWTEFDGADGLLFRVTPGIEQGTLTGYQPDGEHTYIVGSDDALHDLAQSIGPVHSSLGTGAIPQTDGPSWTAFGAAGVLFTDGASFWLGVPTTA